MQCFAADPRGRWSAIHRKRRGTFGPPCSESPQQPSIAIHTHNGWYVVLHSPPADCFIFLMWGPWWRTPRSRRLSASRRPCGRWARRCGGGVPVLLTPVVVGVDRADRATGSRRRTSCGSRRAAPRTCGAETSSRRPRCSTRCTAAGRSVRTALFHWDYTGVWNGMHVYLLWWYW